jgi:hypothetical protein
LLSVVDQIDFDYPENNYFYSNATILAVIISVSTFNSYLLNFTLEHVPGSFETNFWSTATADFLAIPCGYLLMKYLDIKQGF